MSVSAAPSVEPPVSEDEKRLVLDLLPVALNESGIALALGRPSLGVVVRAARVLAVLETEGRVQCVAPAVWHVV